MDRAVSDRQIAALRAQLAGRADEHKALLMQLDWRTEGIAYAALLDAAFFEAVTRRFGGGVTEGEISAYLADVQSRADEAVAPDVAGQLIRKVLGDASEEDEPDPRVAIAVKQFLLVDLTAAARLDDSGLEGFIAEARTLADRWLA
jgi:hypothetical protein